MRHDATPPFDKAFELNIESDQARGLIGWWPASWSLHGNRIYDRSVASGVAHGSLSSNNSWSRYPVVGPVLMFNGTSGASISVETTNRHRVVNEISGFGWTWPLFWNGGVTTILMSLSDTILSSGWEFGVRGPDSNRPAFAYNDGGIRGWYLGNTNLGSATGGALHLGFSYKPGTLIFWLNGVSDGSPAITSGTIVATSDTLRLGYQPNNWSWDGGVGEFRLYNRFLSAPEVAALYAPETRWELYRPILKQYAVLLPAGGGATEYPLEVSGAFTPSATLIKQTNKITAGAFTPSGALIRLTGKPLTGAVAPTGAITRQFQRILSGAITPTATLVKNAQIAVIGVLEPLGALAKETRKTFAGGITPSAVLDAIKLSGVYFIELAGSLPLAGALIKQAQANRSGAVEPSGALVKSTAKTFAGVITPTSALTALRTVLLTLAGALTPSGAVSRQVNKSLSGVITPVGSIAKQIGKALSGAVASAGAFVGALVGLDVDTRGGLTLSDSLVHAVILSDAAVYRVLVSDAARFAVDLEDSQP